MRPSEVAAEFHEDRLHLILRGVWGDDHDVSVLSHGIRFAIEGEFSAPHTLHCGLQGGERNLFAEALEDFVFASEKKPGAALGRMAEIAGFDPLIVSNSAECLALDKGDRAKRTSKF